MNNMSIYNCPHCGAKSFNPLSKAMTEGSDFGRINDMAVEIAQRIKESCAFRA